MWRGPSDALLAGLWTVCGPDDRVKHAGVHASRAGARGVAFLLAPDKASPARRCRAVCRAGSGGVARLRGWRFTGPVEA